MAEKEIVENECCNTECFAYAHETCEFFLETKFEKCPRIKKCINGKTN